MKNHNMVADGWDKYVNEFYRRKDLLCIEFCYACWHRINETQDCDACEACVNGNMYKDEISVG